MVTIEGNGFVDRFSNEIIELDLGQISDPAIRDCHNRSAQDIPKICVFGDLTKKPTFALLGDSHAYAILGALSSAAIRKEFSFIYFGKDGCLPSYNIEGSSGAHENCPTFNENVLEILRERKIQNVIIFNRFNWYFEKSGFKNEYNFEEDKNSFHFAVSMDKN